MANHEGSSALGWTRSAIAGFLTILAAIIWTHTLAGVLRQFGPADVPLAAGSLTIAAALLALLGIATWNSHRSLITVAAAAAGAVAFFEAGAAGSWIAALALLPAVAAASTVGKRLALRLPERLEGAYRRRRRLAALWCLISLVAVVQVGRLSTWVTDPEFDWFLSTRNAFWADHECLPAYIYGTELSARGEENVYDQAHYPGLNPEAVVETQIIGLPAEDPFQYPPQFLLLPRLMISLSSHYPTIRLVWFGAQATLFLLVACWLTAWIGGRRGLTAALLLPLSISAFPTLHTLQYGQFHISAVALAIAALLAFEGRRRGLGGALLAMATLAKIFPGVLLLVLAAQRRWRDLAWTAGFMFFITVAAWGILGPAPFAAFFDYHLPRLANGQAFAFGDVWPEIRELLIADNQGAFGLIEKLQAIGVPGLDRDVASLFAKLFGLATLVAAFVIGRREAKAPRDLRAASWLALLALGSMASTGAFGDYVPLTLLWMMAIVASRLRNRGFITGTIGLAWLCQYFFLGTSPIGNWAPAAIMIPLSTVTLLLAFFACGWVLVRGFAAEDAPEQAERLADSLLTTVVA